MSIPWALSSRSFAHGSVLLRRLVPLVRRLLDLGAQHEDVLVHQGASEPGPVDRSPHGVDLGHRLPLPVSKRPEDAGRIVAAGAAMSQRLHSGFCVSVESGMFGWSRLQPRSVTPCQSPPNRTHQATESGPRRECARSPGARSSPPPARRSSWGSWWPMNPRRRTPRAPRTAPRRAPARRERAATRERRLRRSPTSTSSSGSVTSGATSSSTTGTLRPTTPTRSSSSPTVTSGATS